ncbi:hypothetical protein VKT23_018069 [Stygiomarasmius scandens]|uniref:Small ribosomal subunit protein uS7 domain-containing protein n=1 Tax=Marasmiellus scandens TaxID=2682957 RepID=A0ABR1IQI8_9AGAR
MLRTLSTSLRPSLRQAALATRTLSSLPSQAQNVSENYRILEDTQNAKPDDDMAELLNLDSLTAPKESKQPPLMNIPPQEDPLLHFLASRIMQNGHRARASRIVSRTLLNIHAYTRAPPLPILRQAIFAAAPAVRCLNHRHATKQVLKPIALSEKQGIWYAVKWLLEECKGRQGGPQLEERLAREIIKIIKGESAILEKKARVHKEAMLNRGNVPRTQK